MRDLSEVKEIFVSLANTNSKKAKQFIIRENKSNLLFTEILKFLLDDNVVTGISTKKMNKKLPKSDFVLTDILSAFEYVKQHSTGTDTDISVIKTFCEEQGECEEFCKQLFTKKLKVGVDVKTVNSVIPNLIESFEIMLGSKFDLNKPPKETMFVSEKYDGVRCFTIIKDGVVTIKSRQNKVFEGLVDVEKAIKDLGLDNVCLDGELLAIGSSNENVYKDTMKIVSTKEECKHGVKYMLFDIIPLSEFENKVGTVSYLGRRCKLDMIEESEFINVAPILYNGTDINRIMDILADIRDKGAEGLMVNLNKPYEFKRSKTLLKVKVMQTCDLRIIGFEEGEGRLKGTLGKIICDYKGFELGVGSGYTDSERKEIFQNQDEYLGKIMEVAYFEETSNDKGGLSLRFPIFKGFRNDKTVPSYE